jgi:hypothetical protein
MGRGRLCHDLSACPRFDAELATIGCKRKRGIVSEQAKRNGIGLFVGAPTIFGIGAEVGDVIDEVAEVVWEGILLLDTGGDAGIDGLRDL